MKRLIALLTLLCLLCGCGSQTAQTPDSTGPAVLTDMTTETQQSGDGLIALEPTDRETTAVTEADPPAPGQHQAAYTVLESDSSIRNDNGDVLVDIRYQRVILDTGTDPDWANINDRILEDCNRFREDVAYLRDTPVEDWEQMLQDMGMVYGNLMAWCGAKVTHNSGGIFSICMTREWYLGGVYNSDPYGLNFDLTTGEVLHLARLSDLPAEEFEEQLKGMVCDALAKDFDALFGDPAEVLETYTLDTMDFYMDEGELILTFPTYTFGPGSLGPTVIRTGLHPRLQEK